MKPSFLLLDAPVGVATPSQLGRRGQRERDSSCDLVFFDHECDAGSLPSVTSGQRRGVQGSR